MFSATQRRVGGKRNAVFREAVGRNWNVRESLSLYLFIIFPGKEKKMLQVKERGRKQRGQIMWQKYKRELGKGRESGFRGDWRSMQEAAGEVEAVMERRVVWKTRGRKKKREREEPNTGGGSSRLNIFTPTWICATRANLSALCALNKRGPDSVGVLEREWQWESVWFDTLKFEEGISLAASPG